MNLTEDYVSFEIAQLLKEKGFDVPVYQYYFPPSNDNLNYSEFDNDWNSVWEHAYSAPTHQMALKWLRLCYDIIIDVSPNLTLDDVCKGGFMAEVYQYGHRVPDGEFGCNIGDEYTYEEVVEASLLYVLKNLI